MLVNVSYTANFSFHTIQYEHFFSHICLSYSTYFLISLYFLYIYLSLSHVQPIVLSFSPHHSFFSLSHFFPLYYQFLITDTYTHTCIHKAEVGYLHYTPDIQTHLFRKVCVSDRSGCLKRHTFSSVMNSVGVDDPTLSVSHTTSFRASWELAI